MDTRIRGHDRVCDANGSTARAAGIINNSNILELSLTEFAASYNSTLLERSEPAMDSSHAVQALAALAHETRLALFRMLVERGPDGLSAGVIAERLAVPPSSLTFHVQHLHRAG
ncbi:MAG TPA: helix-turn-helix domain-containing protein, partial [Polyangia bacterium]|nr:helix-turn-helix domain-containing protein [Polyangia bacterium]